MKHRSGNQTSRPILPAVTFTLVLLLAAIILFLNLGEAGLWDRDEPHNAQAAREMLESSDWIVPRFNGEIQSVRPPLIHWLIMSSYSFFGVNEFAARFPSAMFGLGTLILTFLLGCRLFNRGTGILAALILSTTLLTILVARAATPDSLFVFLNLGALYFFARSQGLGPSGQQHSGGHGTRRYSISSGISYFLLGLAVLTKGPVGLVLPFAAFLLFTTVETSSPSADHHRHQTPAALRNESAWFQMARHGLEMAKEVHLIPGALIVGATVLPWYVWVSLETGGEWFRGFFLIHHVNRILTPMEGHSGPLFYYAIALLVGFFPWSVFLGPVISTGIKRAVVRGRLRKETLLLLCWSLVFVCLYSLASTKLPHYILPIYPACAVGLALQFRHWFESPTEVPWKWLNWSLISLIALGALMIPIVWIIARKLLPSIPRISLVGLPLVFGGAIALFFLKLSHLRGAFYSFVVTTSVFLISIFGLGTRILDVHQNARPMTQSLLHSNPEAVLGTFRYFEPSWVFYWNSRIPEFHTVPQAAEFLAAPNTYLLIRETDYEPFAESVLVPTCIAARAQRFLGQDDLLIVQACATAPSEPVFPSKTP